MSAAMYAAQVPEFHGVFAGMTTHAMPIEELVEARRRLVEDIQQRARGSPSRDFLRSFFALAPDWGLLGLDKDVAMLPAVRWKTRNLEALAREQPRKLAAQVASLNPFLDAKTELQPWPTAS